MYESASPHLNPRHGYRTENRAGTVFVRDKETNKTICIWEKPNVMKDTTKSVELKIPGYIFCDPGYISSYLFFSYKPGKRLLVIEADDEYAEVVKSSGKLGIIEYIRNEENMKKIVGKTEKFGLKPGDTRHILSFYFNEFIEKDESPQKFKRWLRKQMKNYDNRSTLDKLKYLFLLNKNSV